MQKLGFLRPMVPKSHIYCSPYIVAYSGFIHLSVADPEGVGLNRPSPLPIFKYPYENEIIQIISFS